MGVQRSPLVITACMEGEPEDEATQEAHFCVIKVGLDSIDMSTMRGREERAIAKLATCLHRERQSAGRREGNLQLNHNHELQYCVLTCHVLVFDLLSQTSSCLPILLPILKQSYYLTPRRVGVLG